MVVQLLHSLSSRPKNTLSCFMNDCLMIGSCDGSHPAKNRGETLGDSGSIFSKGRNRFPDKRGNPPIRVD